MELSRRQALLRLTNNSALSGLGLGVASAFAKGSPQPSNSGKIRSCIIVFYYGGPSHLDMFDMKPDAPDNIRGPFKPISTSVPGTFVSELLPEHAKIMHKITVVRSMHHTNRLHDSASTETLTGRQSPQGDREEFKPIPQFYPAYGAALAKLRNQLEVEVPFAALPWVFRNVLGGGLYETGNYAGALAVMEADLSMKRRLGASERSMLAMQGNLASTYERVGRKEEALSMERNVYSGHLKLNGEEHEDTVIAANNYASSLIRLEHSEEAKALLRKTMPVAQRVLGESHETMLNMRWLYAAALSKSTGATLNDIREAATTLEETERTARRVLGSAHPLTKIIERNLRIVQDLVNRQGLSKK